MELTFGDAESMGRREEAPSAVPSLDGSAGALAATAGAGRAAPPVAGRRIHHPYPLATMIRIHFLQQWCSLSNPSIEEALYDTAVMRRFAGINSLGRIPDETTSLNFRRLLETHGLEEKMRVIKRQFGYNRVRYRGLAKDSARVLTLFAFSNL